MPYKRGQIVLVLFPASNIFEIQLGINVWSILSILFLGNTAIRHTLDLFSRAFPLSAYNGQDMPQMKAKRRVQRCR